MKKSKRLLFTESAYVGNIGHAQRHQILSNTTAISGYKSSHIDPIYILGRQLQNNVHKLLKPTDNV